MYEELGLSTTKLGIVFAVPTALNMFVPILWGFLADKVLGWRVVLTICSLGGCAVYTLLLYFQTFEAVLVIKTFHQIILQGILPVMDGACMEYLALHTEKSITNSEQRALYGIERVFGTVSWGLTHFVLALLFRRYSYLVQIQASIFLSLVFVGYVWFDFFFQEKTKIAYEPVTKKEQQKGEGIELGEFALAETESLKVVLPELEKIPAMEILPPSQNVLRDFLKRVFCEPYNLSVFLTIVVINIGTTLVENLVFLFFALDLGASNLLLGISVVITVSFELPLFAVAPKLLRTFGAPALLVTGLLSYAFRVFGYTMIDPSHRWLVLILEPLHGLTYATIQLSIVHHMTSLAPKGYENFAQAILTAAKALGAAIGVLGGSIAMDRLGATTTYHIAGTMVFVMTAIYGMCFFKHEYGKSNQIPMRN